jgi:CubicO group peptidase (beta-lactamase class C family)
MDFNDFARQALFPFALTALVSIAHAQTAAPALPDPIGIHDQAIYIDPKAQMVIVRYAAHPVAANTAIDPLSLPAYQAVADALMAGK